jgi:putative flippase GtrA
LNRFFRFCVVGTIGFAVDAGVLQVLVFVLGANPYLARIASFLAAASVTWLLNRKYTFAVAHGATRGEWARYTAFMVLGAALNYGAFALALATSETVRLHPWIGVAIGSIAGLGANFLSSALFVFKRN